MALNQNDPLQSTVNKLRFIWLFPVTVIGLFLLVMVARLGWNHWFADDPTAKQIIRPAPKSVGGGRASVVAPAQATATESSGRAATPHAAASPVPERSVPVNAPADVPPITPTPAAPSSTGGVLIQPSAGSRIFGRVRLQGIPPPEKVLPLDANCGKLHATTPTTRFYVVSEEGGLADVFVYLKSGLGGGNDFDNPPPPVLLDQVGCEYTPYVLGLQTRQTLVVRNSDNFLHNVHPQPAVAGNRESNRAQLPKAEFGYVFEQPELFLKFRCDVHPWMFAYVCVLDHRFFAVTDKTGAFVLPNLPPGKYVIEAVHRKAGILAQEITIGTEDRQTADFIFAVQPGP